MCLCVCVCVGGGGGFSVGQSGPIRELKRSGTGTAGHDSWTRIRASHGPLSSQQIITQALISYSSNCSFVLGGRRSEVSGGEVRDTDLPAAEAKYVSGTASWRWALSTLLAVSGTHAGHPATAPATFRTARSAPSPLHLTPSLPRSSLPPTPALPLVKVKGHSFCLLPGFLNRLSAVSWISWLPLCRSIAAMKCQGKCNTAEGKRYSKGVTVWDGVGLGLVRNTERPESALYLA